MRRWLQLASQSLPSPMVALIFSKVRFHLGAVWRTVMTHSTPVPISSRPQCVLCEMFRLLPKYPGMLNVVSMIQCIISIPNIFAQHLNIFSPSSRSLVNFFSSNTPIAQHGLISFIEQQMETSKAMASAKDYRYWLLTLVQHLVSSHSSGFNTEHIEIRLRELCNFLLGQQFPRIRNEISSHSISSTPLPALRRSTNSQASCLASSKVLGISKHELLREVLSVLASNLSLQRLYIEFKEQLDSFSHSTLNSTYLNSSKSQQPQPGDIQSLSSIT